MALHKTQIKFSNVENKGEIVGFVTRNAKTKQLLGVREHSVSGKKICVLSEHLKGTIIPNVLYDVELKEMHQGNGYVVVTASLVQFEPTIEVIIEKRKTYQVKISFGNKTIYFDPVKGKSSSSKTIEGVKAILNSRVDIKHIDFVISEFVDAANLVLNSLNRYGLETNK